MFLSLLSFSLYFVIYNLNNIPLLLFSPQVYKKKTEAAKKEYLKALAAYRASLVSKVSRIGTDRHSPDKQSLNSLSLFHLCSSREVIPSPRSLRFTLRRLRLCPALDRCSRHRSQFHRKEFQDTNSRRTPTIPSSSYQASVHTASNSIIRNSSSIPIFKWPPRIPQVQVRDGNEDFNEPFL